MADKQNTSDHQGLGISFGSGCSCPTHQRAATVLHDGISRRSFATGAAAMIASLPAMLAPAAAAGARVGKAPSTGLLAQTARTYSFALGDVRITALSDGTVPADLHQLLLRTTPAQTDALLKDSYLSNPVEVSINEWVFKVGDRVVLIDTGAGRLFGPGYGGKLVDSLSAAGFEPHDVTDILLTHIHTDHSGGLMRGDERLFTNATVHVGKPDVTFFLDRSNAAKARYDMKYFDEAIHTVKPYVDAGRVNAFDRTTTILPGLSASLHPGHTPGSAFFTLTSQSETILFVGDVIHIAAVQFPDPGVAIVYDVNPAAAVAVRRQAFPQFVRDRTLIAVPHMPFPGVGHVRSVGAGFEWVPLEYVNRAK